MNGRHFEGKAPLAHLFEAREKGKIASSEIHGAELPGHLSAGADACKETSLLLLVLWVLFTEQQFSLETLRLILLVFFAGWLVWKVGRSALLGYSRLERLHRLIEEERWEIEHHRPQEREELKALYAAKGFSGKLLEEVLDVMMADDNRLLQIMLEEELGLSLESYEHPLKQALGACIGTLLSGSLLFLGFFFLPWQIGAIVAAILIGISAALVAKWEKNDPLTAAVWNLAAALLAAGTAFFLAKVVL